MTLFLIFNNAAPLNTCAKVFQQGEVTLLKNFCTGIYFNNPHAASQVIPKFVVVIHLSNAMFSPLKHISSNNFAHCHHSIQTNSFNSFLTWLSNPFDTNSLQKDQSQNTFLQKQEVQIYQNIVNTKKDNNDDYGCFVEFNHVSFLLTQTFFEPTSIIVSNYQSGEELPIKNLSFSELQKHLLIQYIAKHRDLNNVPVDLTAFDLGGINLSEIDFSFTKLNCKNLSSILEYGCHVKNAILVEVPHLQFVEAGIDKALALELIKVGVDPELTFNAYLATARGLGNSGIDINGFNLTAMNLEGIDLDGVAFEPLSQYQGPITINDNLFFISTLRGQLHVKTDEEDAQPVAQELQSILRATSKNEIIKMTHQKLPAALQKLAPIHWNSLGNEILKSLEANGKIDFLSLMIDKFYQSIYKRASENIGYTFSEPPKIRQKEWETLVTQIKENPEWKPEGIQHGKTLALKRKHHAGNIDGATAHLRYRYGVTKSRIQFVVSSGAGPKLYTDIAKVMDQLIHEKYGGNPEHCPVISYKVFSEDHQVGRSDSAVFYLSVSLNYRKVETLVSYLNRSIGTRIAPINIIGATSINGSHIQGINIPKKSLQIQITKQFVSSHGSIISAILALSYQQACDDATESGISPNQIDINALNQRAQFYANAIWSELGL